VQPLDAVLPDQQAIEGAAMVQGQVAHCYGMLEEHRRELELVRASCGRR
jgi:hypothetical protein